MEKVIEKINNIYNFSHRVELLGKVEKGYYSNFIIGNNKEKYFLKAYPNGVVRVKKSHAAEKFFAAHKIPVVLPIESKEGKTYFVCQRTVYAVFPYETGMQYERLKVPTRALQSAGAMLAKIHLLSKDGLPLEVRKRKFLISRKKALQRFVKIEKFITNITRKSEFDRQVLAFIEKKKHVIESNAFSCDRKGFGKRHIIHADYHEENMFFQGSQVKYIFDWEMVSAAPRVMELHRSMDFFCFYGQYEKENFQKAKIYLNAYTQLYPISKKELLNGLRAWYSNKLQATWALEEYYFSQRKDAKPFIEKEMRAFAYYSKNFQSIINNFENGIIKADLVNYARNKKDTR